MPTFVAVDLGATSGRVVNVRLDRDSIELELVRRFPTEAVVDGDGELAWNFDALLDEVTAGLTDAVTGERVASVAVDSWAVDYGLLDADGRRIGPVHAYRSARTDGVMDAVCTRVGRERIYSITGIQFLPFNTAYQLVAARETSEYTRARGLLMVPDLVNHALCRSSTNDVTNASTTQLLDAATRSWSDELIDELGLRRELLPGLHEPGSELGTVRDFAPAVDGLRVVAAASHDTASAVAGVPLRPDRRGIYISCGTWSLVGCEVGAPIASGEALTANVTNELGVGGTVRLLKNVTGLWLLEECRRTWAAEGLKADAAALVTAAGDVQGGRSVVDPDDPSFAVPGDMPSRIGAYCRRTGQPVPTSPAEVTRTILDSLALAWRKTVSTIERVTGFEGDVLHLVGGGSSIQLLRELCASACGRPVIAGPAEATVVGNAIVQAIAGGVLIDLAEGRQLVERSLGLVEVAPRQTLDWDTLATRL
ncbi:MAG: rhamnulokinase [Ilumatobacteraceae bacterium]